MALEGNRQGAGFFSPGEPLSASKLNDLAAMASRGSQWHSAGSQVAQGNFGTVDLSRITDITGIDNPDQFTVTVEPRKDEDNVVRYYFSIVKGYVTASNMSGEMYIAASTDGTVGFGDTKVRDENRTVNNVHAIKSCSTYGRKFDPAGSSLLEANKFAADDEGTSTDIVIILYLPTPFGIEAKPKLGVMRWDTFANNFRGNRNGKFSPAQPNWGSPGGIDISCKATTGVVGETGSTAVLSIDFGMNWGRLGLHVQPIALFDAATKTLYQYKRGHVRMTDPLETRLVSGPVTTTYQAPCIDGWGSYFYQNPAADFTGLKFEEPV